MKKALSLFVLFLLLLSFPVCAASGKLSGAAVSGKVGEQVTVTLRLDNPGIIATRIFVRYDSAVLELNSAENGDLFAKNNADFGKDIHADPYTMLWVDSLRTDNITTSGTLCTLCFTIKKAASGGETNIRFAVDKNSTFDVDLNEVAVADATCTVKTADTSSAAPTAPVTAISGNTSAAASTTTRPAASIASEKSSATTRPITAASATVKTTAIGSTPTKTSAAAGSATSVAKPTAASASAPVTKEESGTTAAAQTVPDIAAPATAETVADGVAEAEEKNEAIEKAASTEAADESGILTIGAAEGSEARHINLLWLLALVPVAAVLLFVIFKKKK